MYFKDIIGQDDLKQKFIENIRNRRISHAQLFTGPEGSGKLALAIAYARYLACKNPGPDDACGACPGCLKYNKLSHPDLNFFYPVPSRTQGGKSITAKDFAPAWRSYLEKSPYVSLNGWYEHIEIENKQGIINAEDCNEVVKVLGYKTYESEYKVVIIWMIERLFHAAAPKLLKILEEPPEKTLFLLVSESADQILNTILSRAQRVKVPPLPDKVVRDALVNRHGCDLERARQVAFLSDGNFLKALTLLDSPDSFEDNMNFLRQWLRDCYAYKIKEIFGHVEILSKMGREKQKALLTYGLEVFRQCTLMNYHVGNLVRVEGEAQDFVKKFSGVLTPAVAMSMTEAFSQAIYAVERNANPKILFTDLSLQSVGYLRGKK